MFDFEMMLLEIAFQNVAEAMARAVMPSMTKVMNDLSGATRNGRAV